MSQDRHLQPRRPTHMPEFAEECLQALAAHGLGDRISIGGALGLLHYLDYRSTHDVDAWWQASSNADDQHRMIQVLETTLQRLGDVKTRTWGETISVELRR